MIPNPIFRPGDHVFLRRSRRIGVVLSLAAPRFSPEFKQFSEWFHNEEGHMYVILVQGELAKFYEGTMELLE